MFYSNHFVQTGAQSDVSENLTTNIAPSYRMGAGLTVAWDITQWFV